MGDVGEREGHEHVGVELVVAVMNLHQGVEGFELLVERREQPCWRGDTGAVVQRVEHRPAEGAGDHSGRNGAERGVEKVPNGRGGLG